MTVRMSLLLVVIAVMMNGCGNVGFGGKSDSKTEDKTNSVQASDDSSDAKDPTESSDAGNPASNDTPTNSDNNDPVTTNPLGVITTDYDPTLLDQAIKDNVPPAYQKQVKAEIEKRCPQSVIKKLVTVMPAPNGKYKTKLAADSVVLLTANSFELHVEEVTQDLQAVCVVSYGDNVVFQMDSAKSITNVLISSAGTSDKATVNIAASASVSNYSVVFTGSSGLTRLLGDGAYKCPSAVDVGTGNELECTN